MKGSRDILLVTHPVLNRDVLSVTLDLKGTMPPHRTVQQKDQWMNKILRTVLVASLFAAKMIAAKSSAPASAAYCVGIYRIYYNSPGSDTGNNTSLNGEWIQLHNKSVPGTGLVRLEQRQGHCLPLQRIQNPTRQVLLQQPLRQLDLLLTTVDPRR